jgi:adenosylhomocysteinase
LQDRHFQKQKDGAFILNVGHSDEEIDLPALYSHPHCKVLPHIERIEIGSRAVYLFAGGSMANLTAGYGDSTNGFDLTLAIMVAAIGYAVKESSERPPGV